MLSTQTAYSLIVTSGHVSGKKCWVGISINLKYLYWLYGYTHIYMHLRGLITKKFCTLVWINQDIETGVNFNPFSMHSHQKAIPFSFSPSWWPDCKLFLFYVFTSKGYTLLFFTFLMTWLESSSICVCKISSSVIKS